MMKIFNIIFVLSLLFFSAGCESKPGDSTSTTQKPKAQISTTFATFQKAVAGKDFAGALAMTSAGTVDLFEQVRRQVLYASAESVIILNPVRQTWILGLRASKTTEQLQALDGQGTFLQLAEKGLLFPVPANIYDVRLANIKVQGTEALADIQVNKMPINVGPAMEIKDYGFFTSLGHGQDVYFVQEDGGWKFDLGSLFKVTEMLLEEKFLRHKDNNIEQVQIYTGSLLNRPLPDNVMTPPLGKSSATKEAFIAYKAKDYQKAHTLALQEAEKSISVAYALLADIYKNGLGVEADPAEAEKWQIKAAEALDGVALHEIAIGVLNDPEQGESAAIPWFERAAFAGSVPAMIYLGGAYANGKGVRADRAIAKGWFLNCTILGSRGCYEAYQSF